MSKRKFKFEDIDMNEISAGKPDNIAMFGWQNNFNGSVNVIAFGYIDGFKKAADLLVDEGYCPDEDMFPVMFCYRQYIELLLKNILGRNVDKEDYKRKLKDISHDLLRLWQEANCFVKSYILLMMNEDLVDDFFAFFYDVIVFFDKYDRGSFNFRYPTTKKLEQSIPVDNFYVNLKRLKKAVDAIEEVMYGTYGI